MDCPTCNGEGSLPSTNDEVFNSLVCSDCNGTGKVLRFITEVMKVTKIKEYLDTEPHPEYRLVAVTTQGLLLDGVLIWERIT